MGDFRPEVRTEVRVAVPKGGEQRDRRLRNGLDVIERDALAAGVPKLLPMRVSAQGPPPWKAGRADEAQASKAIAGPAIARAHDERPNPENCKFIVGYVIHTAISCNKPANKQKQDMRIARRHCRSVRKIT